MYKPVVLLSPAAGPDPRAHVQGSAAPPPPHPPASGEWSSF